MDAGCMQRRCVLARAVMYGEGDSRHTDTRYCPSVGGAGGIFTRVPRLGGSAGAATGIDCAPIGADGRRVRRAWAGPRRDRPPSTQLPWHFTPLDSSCLGVSSRHRSKRAFVASHVIERY